MKLTVFSGHGHRVRVDVVDDPHYPAYYLISVTLLDHRCRTSLHSSMVRVERISGIISADNSEAHKANALANVVFEGVAQWLKN